MIAVTRLDGRADFYFLRHGESLGNTARVMQGRRDFALSLAGRSQAREAARWLAGKGITTVLSSPLARARETAQIVAEALGTEAPILQEELTELDTGIFTGMTIPQARSCDPRAWRRFQRRSWQGVPRAERISQLRRRAAACWEILADRAAGGSRSILAVTHSGILQWLIKASFGHRRWMPLFPMGNCGISLFHVDNRLNGPEVRRYCEWTYLNVQPTAEEPGSWNVRT